MRLIFATNNKHKMSEIKDILGEKYKNIIFLMGDLDVHINPVENGETFGENSMIKAKALYKELKNKNKILPNDYIVADDTGLCIDYLDGAPGIYSARFMGENTSQEEKNLTILELMKDVPDEKRTAHFTTNLAVICVDKDKNPTNMSFEAGINGYIAKKIEKTGGFGYDPIFAVGDTSDIEKGQVKTYSNIGMAEKNKTSHRARALNLFVQYLEKNHNI